MRVFKFRSWMDRTKMMEYWDLGHVPDYLRLTDTVMQFTGLLDKSGKEIYEGDIVRWKYINRAVEWIEKSRRHPVDYPGGADEPGSSS